MVITPFTNIFEIVKFPSGLNRTTRSKTIASNDSQKDTTNHKIYGTLSIWSPK